MSVQDENLTKCALLVQRSPQALTDYHAMLFPPHFRHARETGRERERERESRYDYESTKYYRAFFYERKTKYL